MRICGAGLAGQADTDVVTIQGIANGVAVPVSIATVKPASTAALATDAALVVTEPGSTTAGACANTAVTSSSSAVLAANTARREVTVVNTDVVVVYLGLGQVPTATTYHVALSPCATAHDGTGGSYISDVWKGAINAIVASTGGHVAVTEMT
jgi:predicted TIM-barrel enzyme